MLLLLLNLFAMGLMCTIAAPDSLIMQSTPRSVTREPLAEIINITTGVKTLNNLPAGEEVRTLERFFRLYDDGTIEFKLVLSNGLAQFLKITHKIVDGTTIQVQEGYNSELLPDGTYRTSHFIADENGYRLLRREFDTKPPVLPVYVPHIPKVTTRVK